jgi:glutaminyl-peptide cyclotransferase
LQSIYPIKSKFFYAALSLLKLLCPSPCEASQSALEVITWKLEHELPHDPEAFTQGLEVWGNSYFLETTGLYGKSEIRKVERLTGKIVSAQVLDAKLFGEGVTRLGPDILQLTWREGTILKWKFQDAGRRASSKNKGGFRLQSSHPWSGEGWGITQGNGSLWISNGSSQLSEVDNKTFAVKKILPITMSGKPMENLNELEFVNGKIFANIWMTSTIVRINPKTGIVDGLMDLSPLTPKNLPQDAVANGIAWDSVKKRIYVTGKLWPTIFELSLTN